MHIVLDNIVFSLQKAGGISTLWGELVMAVERESEFETAYLEYVNASANIVRKELQLSRDKIINSKRKKLHLQFERFLSPKFPRRNSKFLYFSSYYRTCSNRKAINITLVHDFTHEYFHKGMRRFVHSAQKKKAIEKADGVICISENTKKDLLNFFPNTDHRKIKVISNGVADHFFQIKNGVKWQEIGSEYKHLEESKIVIFVGSRVGYKNFVLAVEAVALLPSGYHFVIVGAPLSEGEKEFLENALKSNSFTVFSNIDNATLNQIYNKGFVLLYPSSYEGFGIPVLEAMKTGLPVIAQNASSLLEVAGDAGILLDDVSAENIKNQITRLEDKNYYQAISEKGFIQASKFSWKKTMQEYVVFLEHLYNTNEK